MLIDDNAGTVKSIVITVATVLLTVLGADKIDINSDKRVEELNAANQKLGADLAEHDRLLKEFLETNKRLIERACSPLIVRR